MKKSHENNFHFLQVMMKRMMKKMMKKIKKKFSRKLLNNNSNLKICTDYNINCEIVLLISILAKILCEIKCYQKFTEFLISDFIFYFKLLKSI